MQSLENLTINIFPYLADELYMPRRVSVIAAACINLQLAIYIFRSTIGTGDLAH